MNALVELGHWARGNGLQIVLLILGSILLSRLVRWSSSKITERIDARSDTVDSMVKSEAAKHRHVLAQVISWLVLVIMYTTVGVVIIELIGVPLASFVAPATVLGVALGFGAQRVVQDLLSGFFVIAERQYGFGDLIRISVIGVVKPVLGTVEDVTLRITTVRSASGEVVITPNGQIVQVTNLSRDWARAVIDVPVAATADVTKVSDLLRAVGLAAYADLELRPLLLDAPTVMGVESIEVDQFQIRLVARTLPGKQFEVGRALRMRITSALSQAGINLPAALDTATLDSSAADDHLPAAAP
ncbi:small conductance mechanosensitive channel [Nakamurella sp. UYEF19]|uniref:mechanosensitive ion channel family protein n=1 Tax=Nakamurella sp. UYEF19 TaxID=1756392 RepID=UPI0033955557